MAAAALLCTTILFTSCEATEITAEGPPASAVPDAPKPTTPPAPAPTNPTTTAKPAAPTTTAKPVTTTTAPKLVSGATTFQQTGKIQQLGGCQLHPRNHFLNATNIDKLPKHPRSDAWLAPLDDGSPLLPPRGALSTDGARRGMPFNIVNSDQTGMSKVLVNLNWTSKSYQGGYPMPYRPIVQGFPGWHLDKHVLLLDQADCTAYELIGFEPLSKQMFGNWTALAGGRYPLNTNQMPVLTTNSPNTPMFGQYPTVAEANTNTINHVTGWCSNIIGSSKVWPARMSDGQQSPDAIPMGAWIRLKAGVDPNQFTGQARSIANALRKHGAVLTDTCGHRFAIMAEASDKWNDTEMDQLRSLGAGDFEVVNSAGMIVDPTTYEIR